MKKKDIKIELTPEQKEQLEKETGKQVSEVKLCPNELEARVAPRVVFN
jgi:uncharacterized protein YaaN involved in tellurite resistance